MVTALILAFVGGAIGILAFFWLARHAEATGYAKQKNAVPREHMRSTPDQS